MISKTKITAFFIVITLFFVFSTAYTVNYDEHMVVTQFGKIIRSVSKPGLYFKTPFVTTLASYTKKLIEYDADPVSVITSDKKTIIFDTIAMYRIADPALFFQRVGTLSAAEKRIDDAVYSAVRNVAGRMSFEDIIHTRRIEATDTANEMAAAQAAEYGIEIIRTKFKKVLLPLQNEESIFKSMIDERMTIAEQLRAEGNSKATEIVSAADKARAMKLASANEQAATAKAEGDRIAQETIAKAVERNPDLYMLMKNFDIYRSAIGKSTIVIDPTKGIFKNFIMPWVEKEE
jgi:membrane protease subunit HflC